MKTEITICPSTLAVDSCGYSPYGLKRLFDRQKVSYILPYDNPESGISDTIVFANNHKRTALSGSKVKYSMLVQDGVLKLAPDKKRGTHILKTIPKNIVNPNEYVANEHLTMQLAEQVFKLETAPNGICFFKNGDKAYFTRRFDFAGKDNKYRVEDFASLAGLTSDNAGINFKYQYSYEEVAELIKKYLPAWRIELLKFYRLMLFNFLFSNGDTHLKKISVIETRDGDFKMAPVYGLLNTKIHGNEVEFALYKGLFKERYRQLYKGGAKVIGATLRAFGLHIGLPEAIVDKELKFFRAWHPDVENLINRSFLSERMKKIYFAHYRSRRGRLIDMEL